MVFSVYCVHKSIAPQKDHCIKLVTTYTHNASLSLSLQHKRAAKLFQAAQWNTADTPPYASADLASMIYGVLQNVNTMNACTARAYNFMLFIAAGAMSLAPCLNCTSLTQQDDASLTQAKVDSVITSTLKSLGSNSQALISCKRCAHRRAPILID